MARSRTGAAPLPRQGPTGDPGALDDEDDGHEDRVGPGPRPDAAGRSGLLSLRGWTRGERIIVVAGGALAVVLWRLPWHRFGLTVADEFRRLGLGEIPMFQALEPTALETPNGFLGRGALLVAVAMVVAVVVTRLVASRRAVPAFWQQAHLVAGSSVLGLLVAKVAAKGDFLAPWAWLAVGLAAFLAYGGFTRSQEVDTSGGEAAASPLTPPAEG